MFSSLTLDRKCQMEKFTMLPIFYHEIGAIVEISWIDPFILLVSDLFLGKWLFYLILLFSSGLGAQIAATRRMLFPKRLAQWYKETHRTEHEHLVLVAGYKIIGDTYFMSLFQWFNWSGHCGINEGDAVETWTTETLIVTNKVVGKIIWLHEVVVFKGGIIVKFIKSIVEHSSV